MTELRVLSIVFVLAACGSNDAVTPDAQASPSPLCTGEAVGAYCGGDGVDHADSSTLYQCAGAGTAPIVLLRSRRHRRVRIRLGQRHGVV